MDQSSAVSKTNIFKRLLRSKPLRILLIIAAIAALLWFGVLRGAFSRMSALNAAAYIPVEVTRDDMTVLVSGTGVASPLQQFDIVSTVQGDVLSDTIEIGQKVLKDELLYQIDDTDAQTGIRRAELALERSEVNYEQALDSSKPEDARITSGITGTIVELYVKNGDMVTTGARIAEVADRETLLLRVPFNASDADALRVGDAAVITLETSGEVLTGRVSKVLTGTYAADSGAVARDVEVTFSNPGAVKTGDLATAQCAGRACQDAGSIDFGSTATVTAKAIGEIQGLTASAGDRITRGSVLAYVDTDDIQSNQRIGALGLEEARLSLDESFKQLDNFRILSPIDGIIVDKLFKEGDTLEMGRTTLAIVADMKCLVFTMNIDELDVGKIEAGQTVLVTADALGDQVFTGVVDNVGILGVSLNGVTTYPVKVEIADYGALRPGMNLNAEIIVSTVNQVLQIPINAVSRGNLVLVSEQVAEKFPTSEGDREQKPGTIVNATDTPDGFRYIRVSVGVSDGDFVEITDGLTEGMEVFMAAPSSQMGWGFMNGNMGNMGGMGGNMSGGMVVGG